MNNEYICGHQERLLILYPPQFRTLVFIYTNNHNNSIMSLSNNMNEIKKYRSLNLYCKPCTDIIYLEICGNILSGSDDLEDPEHEDGEW